MSTAEWLRVLAVVVCVLAVDQLSKHLVQQGIVSGEEHKLLPAIELVNARNHGVAFGFLPGQQGLVTVLIAGALLALVVYFARNHRRAWLWLPTGMLIGGALGNILDRAREGSVTDFIKLPLGWPAFNLADVSITVGVLILIVLIEARSITSSRDGSTEGPHGTPTPMPTAHDSSTGAA